MEFQWYTKIEYLDHITQGDIIPDCMIPELGEGVYENILKGKEGELNFNIDESNVIIMSQACDIENNKISSLIVCPVWSLKEFVIRNSHFKSSDAKESLRQGKEPAYHLLNESSQISFPFSVVDFHRIYS
ncbi:MAG TPA: hypothetical protein PKV80_29205, partial [Leptospiraceae bacterium]|nr:hypothetical protein [Leptospiraceae bacterium]